MDTYQPGPAILAQGPGHFVTFSFPLPPTQKMKVEREMARVPAETSQVEGCQTDSKLVRLAEAGFP